MRPPGFMSYTHDPSLRRHTSGPIEPLDYDYGRKRYVEHSAIVGLVVAAIALVVIGAVYG